MSTVTSINLVKGAKVDLTKTNPSLSKVALGLGWDANKGNGNDFDLDAFALILKGGKLLNAGEPSLVYFNHLTSAGVTHSGDERTGAASGDDETISIEFSKVPADCDEILLAVNIYDAVARGNQNFGMVSNAYIRAYDAVTTTEIARYDLSEDYSANNCIIFGKVYRKDGEWKFAALGTGTNGTITDVANAYN